MGVSGIQDLSREAGNAAMSGPPEMVFGFRFAIDDRSLRRGIKKNCLPFLVGNIILFALILFGGDQLLIYLQVWVQISAVLWKKNMERINVVESTFIHMYNRQTQTFSCLWNSLEKRTFFKKYVLYSLLPFLFIEGNTLQLVLNVEEKIDLQQKVM